MVAVLEEKLGLDAGVSLAGSALAGLGEPLGQENTASASRVPFATLIAGRPLVDQFSSRYLRDIGMYIYECTAGEAHAAISSQQQLSLVDTVAWTLRRKVIPEFAAAADIASALARIGVGETIQAQSNGSLASVARTDGEEDAVETLRDLASGAPIVRAVNEIIQLALERRATDIHLEPVRDGLSVRIRVDGILTTVRTFTRPGASHCFAGKDLAALNIAERRLPQDGRSRVRVGNFEADIRIATMPTAFGEAAILRLLQDEKGIKDSKTRFLVARFRVHSVGR